MRWNCDKLARIHFGVNLENKFVNTISNLSHANSIILLLIFINFVLMVFFFKSNYRQYGIYTLCIIIGLLYYLHIIKTNDQERTQCDCNSKNSGWLKFILCIYFICFTSSLLYLQFFESNYKISIIYYILVAICITSLFFMSIITGGQYRSLTVFLLAILAFNIYYSTLIVFPNGIYKAHDTFYLIYEILIPTLEFGKVPSGYTYSFFPLHVIDITEIALVTNLNSTHLYYSILPLLYAIIVLFIYVICKNIIGLIYTEVSIIFYLISPDIIYAATHAYQFSYALPVGVITLFITIMSILHKQKVLNVKSASTTSSWSLLYIILLVALVWTHHYTSLMILFLILIYIFVFSVLTINNGSYNKNKEFKYISSIYSLISLFLVIIFAHWMYVSTMLDDVIDSFGIYYNALFNPTNYMPSTMFTATTYQVSFLSILMNSYAKGVILSLAVIGTLHAFWKKDMSVYMIAPWGLVIFILISLGAYTHLYLLMPDRLFSLFFVVSAVYLAAKGFFAIKNSSGKYNVIAFCIILLLASISGLGNTESGSERSIFMEDMPYHVVYNTEHDLKMEEWIIIKAPLDSTIRLNDEWKLSYQDTKRNYINLPLNSQDQIEFNVIQPHEYFILEEDYLTGFRIIVKNELKTIKINSSDFHGAELYGNKIYSTSDNNIYLRS